MSSAARAEGPAAARVALAEEPGPPAQEVFAGLRSAGRPIPNLYKVLANSPVVLKAWVDFAWPLRSRLASPRGLRELAITYLATRRQSEYVRTHHRRFARRHGVSDEQIGWLSSTGWVSSDGWSREESLVLQLVDEVVAGGAATETTIAGLQAVLGAEQAVELVVTVAFYEAVCVVNRSFAIPLEPGSSD